MAVIKLKRRVHAMHQYVDETPDGRHAVRGTRGLDGKPLHYSSRAEALRTAWVAYEEPARYEAGQRVYVRLLHKRDIRHALVVARITAADRAALVEIDGTTRLVPVKKLAGPIYDIS